MHVNKDLTEVKILEHNINETLEYNMSWFTVYVKGFPRSVLQELSRHTSIKPSIESSRYTLKKHLKGKSIELLEATPIDDIWGKWLWLADDYSIDVDAHLALGNLVGHIERGCSNDSVKTLVPEGLRFTGVLTMTLEAWRWLYNLRTTKEVYAPFRDMVLSIDKELKAYSLIDSEPNPYISHSNLKTAVTGCRVCWDSIDKSDNCGENDLKLLKKVTVKFKHRSILHHLLIRTTMHDLALKEIVRDNHYRKFVETGNGLILINMRTIFEILEDSDFIHKEEVIKVIPSKYMYLLDKGE